MQYYCKECGVDVETNALYAKTDLCKNCFIEFSKTSWFKPMPKPKKILKLGLLQQVSTHKNRWEVPSSNGKLVYAVTISHSGEWQCGCPAWTRNVPREDCKHILKVKLACIPGAQAILNSDVSQNLKDKVLGATAQAYIENTAKSKGPSAPPTGRKFR